MSGENALEVLDKPLSKQLMDSAIPARFAYTGSDGFPRVVPIAFEWTGTRFVICTLPHAPKVRALTANPKVALTIDTNGYPPNVLLVRGTASVELVEGIPPEYLTASRKLVPDEEWDAWEGGIRALYDRMARITIEPEWARLLDFETTLPSPVEQLLRERG